MVDAQTLVTGLARLSGAAVQEFPVDAMLHRLCEVAMAAVAVDGAGVVAAEDGGSRFVHAIGVSGARTAERLQDLLGDGPCMQAIRTAEPVVVPDTTADQQFDVWSRAVSCTAVRSVLAVPLLIRDRTWGALDLYRMTPGDWSAQDIDAAVLLAQVAASYVVMAIDRNDAAAARAELEARTLTDQLTGLPNRTLLTDRLGHAVTVAARAGRAVGVLFLDLDRFKQVNDTFGHDTGDQLLIEVAHRMQATLRAGDTLARLAGDEFVLLCEDLDPDPAVQLEQITGISTRLHQALARPVTIAGSALTASVSIGASVATRPAQVADLLAEADGAMYTAKARRTGPVTFHDRAAPRLGQARRRLQHDLPGALDLGQLSLDYQPLVDPATGRFDIVEALLRWDHPDLGRLGADRFVPLADAAGLLPAFGRWVVGEAARQLAHWDRALGPDAPETVFCNFTPAELVDPRLDGAIRAARARYGLGAHRLGLEVLESAFADPLLHPVLRTYHQRGHPVAIDDFGVGYSSLARLVTLPVDHAKIDRSLVSGLPGDSRSRAVVDAVRVIASSLGLAVTAEGVETAAQAAYLTAAGCDRLQGYLLYRPTTGEEITAILRRPVGAAVGPAADEPAADEPGSGPGDGHDSAHRPVTSTESV